TNNGPDTAGNVTLTNPLPANTTLVSWTTTANGWTLTEPTVSNVVTPTAFIASLAPNGSATFTLTVQVDLSTPVNTVLTDIATLQPATWDSNPIADAGNYQASQQTTVETAVAGIPTTTSLTAAPTTSSFGMVVTFTATVNSSGTPTGTVTFDDGATSIGTGTLNGSGVATFSTSTLSVTGSPHTISAVYSGDNTFTGSTSNSLTQAVLQGTSSTALAVVPTTSAFGA